MHFPALEHFAQDIRYALRGLRNSPAFTVAVVLTLGLGIGANAAMFGVIDELMLRPYAYLRDPANVQRVYLRMPGRQRLLTRESFPYTRYLDLEKWTTSFSKSAAFFPTTVAVGTGDAARERPIAAVSASFFDFFRARPVLGRFFDATEDVIPSGANVAVLSWDYWQSAFGGRDVLGQALQVDNIVCTIIGVAPARFSGVADGSPPAVFIPITTFGAHQPGGSSVEYWRRYTWDWAEMIVRRKPGVTLAQANADLTQAYIRSREAARAIHSFMPAVDPVRPLAIAGAVKTAAGPYPGLEARTLLWATGVAAIVLIVACANVVNLFLNRALRRRREIALRLALGVTLGRLAAQSVTESLVLALLGCAVGVALAQWGTVALSQVFVPGGVPDVGTDWRTLGVALAAALVAGLLTGLAPVLLASRDDLARMLKAGTRSGTHHRSRLRSALLVSQAALSVALLVGGGLFVRSLQQLGNEPLGYDADPVLLVHWERRGAQMTTDERMALRHRLLDVATAIPGVEHAAWASNIPVQGTSTMSLFVPGIDSVARLGRFTYQSAGTDYFATMGTRIVRGRSFTNADAAGAPMVVVVSEQMARTLWPGRDALGQCLHAGVDTMPCSTVIGVSEDAVHDPVADQPMRFYLPMEQFPGEGGSLLVLRVRGDPARVAEPVRRRLQSAMPGQQYVTTEPMSAMVDAQRRSWRAGATMFVAFGALALIVAAVGLYGVIGYDVTQRMHELGVRVALGAQRTSIIRLVVGQSVRFAFAGTCTGLGAAWLGGRWVQPLLFHESARDPAVYVAVAAAMVVVAIVASASPAFRAASADPITSLKAE